jgi:hypothetical protein
VKETEALNADLMRSAASNEGMPGSDEGLQSDSGNRLGEVVRTKEEIGAKPKHKPSH